MAVSYEDKIKEQSQPYLEPGERVLAAIVARPRGTTTAMAGGLGAGAIAGRKIAKQNRTRRTETGQPHGLGAHRESLTSTGRCSRLSR